MTAVHFSAHWTAVKLESGHCASLRCIDSGCPTRGVSWLVAFQDLFGVSLVGWIESSAKTGTFSEISEPYVSFLPWMSVDCSLVWALL